MTDFNDKEYTGFEEIKQRDENGDEFWFARELASILGYQRWENFSKAIDRAMLACKNSGHDVYAEFREVTKFVKGSAVERTVKDYELSRYACYLIVQNGDPRKEIIALGQTYFAIQTRRQEVHDYFNRLDEDNKRLVIRGDVKQWNMMLADAAHAAGVISDEEFAIFQNAGYMGLYGGEDVQMIHNRKGLRSNERILDFMNSSELIANLFRITQAEEKLRNEDIRQKDEANEAHFEVGKIVRNAINQTGGTMPEDQPTPKSSITEVEREQIRAMKNRKNKMLDEF